MTVSSEQVLIEYVGDGSTVTFAYPFRVDRESDIEVFLDYGVALPAEQYAVALNADKIGGTVTMIDAPVVLMAVTIYRSMPILQEAQYNPYDPFPAESHEKALDWITMMMQQLNERITFLGAIVGYQPGVQTSSPPYAAGEIWHYDPVQKKLVTSPIGDLSSVAALEARIAVLESKSV